MVTRSLVIVVRRLSWSSPPTYTLRRTLFDPSISVSRFSTRAISCPRPKIFSRVSFVLNMVSSDIPISTSGVSHPLGRVTSAETSQELVRVSGRFRTRPAVEPLVPSAGDTKRAAPLVIRIEPGL